MDFQSAQKTAEEWISSPKIPFQIIDTDSEGRRIVFTSTITSDTFYIVGPNTENGITSWHLWSDDDGVLVKLNPVIDFLQSCKRKTLTEILDKTAKLLMVGTNDLGIGDADENLIDDGIDSGDNDDDDDDDIEGYYDEEDPDAIEDTGANVPDDEQEENDMYTKQGNPTAVKRLLKDWKNVRVAEKFGIGACPRGNNLFVWDVKLKDIPKNTVLGRDLQEYAKRYHREAAIDLEMTFPEDYPMVPPFVRILQPRFQFLTGHVTVGGSICMELLTRSGWRPTYDIENLLIQIRSEILSDPNASLDKRNPDRPYDLIDAQRAFDRMVSRHGWNK